MMNAPKIRSNQSKVATILASSKYGIGRETVTANKPAKITTGITLLS